MRRIAVLFALLVSLSMAEGSHAADLQAGWYVKLGGATLAGYDPVAQIFRAADFVFTGGLGINGPFEVTSPAAWPNWPERVVSVYQSTRDTAPGAGLYLSGQANPPVTWPVTDVVVRWETNCDASQMRLELYDYSPSTGYTLLWTHGKSGYTSGYYNLLDWDQTIPVGHVPVFRVVAVPEASTLLSLMSGAAGLLLAYRRRRISSGHAVLLLACLSIVLPCSPAQALTSDQVLVVWNGQQPLANASQGVARYYAQARGIPPGNLLELQTSVADYVTEGLYGSGIAAPISNYLSNHPNIRVIVLCYGVPYHITGSVWPAASTRRSRCLATRTC